MVFFFLMIRRTPRSTRTVTLFPYTTLFRSRRSSLAFMSSRSRLPSADPARRRAAEGARSWRFLALYALANAGGVAAFLPLLTLLLPLKVQAVAGDERLLTLTLCALAGAVTASISNIAFGTLSDRSFARTRNRRRWIAGGLAATLAT